MKFPPKLLFVLSYIQITIGCCLAGFAAIVLAGLESLFYFVIGLCNIFMGSIVNLKAIEGSTK